MNIQLFVVKSAFEPEQFGTCKSPPNVMRLCSEANIRIIANNRASLSRVKPLTDGHD